MIKLNKGVKFYLMLKHYDEEWNTNFIVSENEVETLEVIDCVYKDIEKSKVVAFDFETSKIAGDDDEDVNPFVDSLYSVSFCANTDYTYAFRLQDESNWIYSDKTVKKIEKLFSDLFDEQIIKILHNAKFDLKMVWRILGRYPNPFNTSFEDTMILCYLLDENRTQKLKFASDRYLDMDTQKYERELNSVGKKGKIESVGWFISSRYNCADSYITRKLWFVLRDLANKEGVLELYEKLYLGFILVLLEAEITGFKIDMDYIKRKSREYKEYLKDIEKFLQDFTNNPEFNPRSHLQVRKVLKDLGLDKSIQKRTKKSKEISTDKEVMESLIKVDDTGFVEKMVEYGRKEKERTFFDGFIDRAVEIDNECILRTKLLPNGTRTGRLSSRDPNFQNLIRGKLLKDAFLSRFYKKLVIADFSQIELRVVAFNSGDEIMLEVYEKGGDIHSRTAKIVFGLSCDESEVKEKYPKERKDGKEVNFGVLYGLTAMSLAKKIDRSEDEAQSFINAYFEEFTRVRDHIREVYEFVIENEYVVNIFGRRRRFPGLNRMYMLYGSDHEAVASKLREAFNFTIQSVAVDICDLSIVKIKRAALDAGIDATFLMQVHDEMIWEVEELKIREFCNIVREQSEKVVDGLKTPIDIEVCEKWGDVYDRERV